MGTQRWCIMGVLCKFLHYDWAAAFWAASTQPMVTAAVATLLPRSLTPPVRRDMSAMWMAESLRDHPALLSTAAPAATAAASDSSGQQLLQSRQTTGPPLGVLGLEVGDGVQAQSTVAHLSPLPTPPGVTSSPTTPHDAVLVSLVPSLTPAAILSQPGRVSSSSPEPPLVLVSPSSSSSSASSAALSGTTDERLSLALSVLPTSSNSTVIKADLALRSPLPPSPARLPAKRPRSSSTDGRPRSRSPSPSRPRKTTLNATNLSDRHLDSGPLAPSQQRVRGGGGGGGAASSRSPPRSPPRHYFSKSTAATAGGGRADARHAQASLASGVPRRAKDVATEFAAMRREQPQRRQPVERSGRRSRSRSPPLPRRPSPSRSSRFGAAAGDRPAVVTLSRGNRSGSRSSSGSGGSGWRQVRRGYSGPALNGAGDDAAHGTSRSPRRRDDPDYSSTTKTSE
jgi:hypothetical protein